MIEFLTVAKLVTGAMGDHTKTFTFTLTGLAAEDYKVVKTLADGTTDSSLTKITAAVPDGETAAKTTFTLKANEVIAITIPESSDVSLTEQTDYYTATFAAVKTDTNETVNLTTLPTGATGSNVNGVRLKAKDNTMLTVTNNLDAVSPTGITFTYMPYLLMLLCGAVLLLLRRRKLG